MIRTLWFALVWFLIVIGGDLRPRDFNAGYFWLRHFAASAVVLMALELYNKKVGSIYRD